MTTDKTATSSVVNLESEMALARIAAGINAKGLRSAAMPTITFRMGRRAFASFLHETNGDPMTYGDDWKRATTSEEPATGGFCLVETFTDALIGPIVAKHENDLKTVHVTVRQPSEGSYRTAADFVALARSLRRSEGVKNISLLDTINPINGKKMRDCTGHEVGLAGAFFTRMGLVKNAQSAEDKKLYALMPAQFLNPFREYIDGAMTAQEAQAEIDALADTDEVLREWRDLHLRDIAASTQVGWH